MSVSISFVNQTQQESGAPKKGGGSYLTIGEANSILLKITNSEEHSITLTTKTEISIDLAAVLDDPTSIKGDIAKWKLTVDDTFLNLSPKEDLRIQKGESLPVELTNFLTTREPGNFSNEFAIYDIEGCSNVETSISIELRLKAIKGDKPLDLEVEWNRGGHNVEVPIGHESIQFFTINTQEVGLKRFTDIDKETMLLVAFDEGYGAGQMPHAHMELEISKGYGMNWQCDKVVDPKIGWKLYVKPKEDNSSNVDDTLFQKGPNSKLELKLTTFASIHTGVKGSNTLPGMANLKISWSGIPDYKPDRVFLEVIKQEKYLVNSTVVDTSSQTKPSVIRQGEFSYVVDITDGPVAVKFKIKGEGEIWLGNLSLGFSGDETPTEIPFIISESGIQRKDNKNWISKDGSLWEESKPQTEGSLVTSHILIVEAKDKKGVLQARTLKLVCVNFQPSYGENDYDLKNLVFRDYDFTKPLKNGKIRSLRGANLTGANLSAAKPATLTGIDLSNATLIDADLSGADLSGAWFLDADLSRANFRASTLSGADFRASTLSGADLSGAKLDGAILWGAHLNEVTLFDPEHPKQDFTGTNLTLATLKGVDLSKITLKDAIFYDVDLSHRDLSGVDLSKANLRKVILSYVDLNGRDFTEINLSEAVLRETILNSAILRKAHLEGAHLEGAHLEGAHLEGAHLEGAHLEGAHLEGAHLEGAHLEGAHLKGAHLEGAHLEGAHLEGANMRGAIIDDRTMFDPKWRQVWSLQNGHADVYDFRGWDFSYADLAELNIRENEVTGANLDLSGANLSYADLLGAYLKYATMDQVNFRGAVIDEQTDLGKYKRVWSVQNGKIKGDALRGISLQNADLVKCDFSGADLSEAKLQDANLKGAHLEGAILTKAKLERTNFSGAHMKDAKLDELEMKDVDLRGADLSGATFEHSKFGWSKIDKTTIIDPKWMLVWSLQQRTQIVDSDIFGYIDVELSRRRLDLSNVDLSDVSIRLGDLYKADLSNSNFYNTYFSVVNLQKANFWNSKMEKAQFCSYIDLRGANFNNAILNYISAYKAKLQKALMKDAYLQGAKLQGAHLQGAHLERAHLEQALLHGADLRDAHLGGTYMSGLLYDNMTKWTPGFDPKKYGAINVDVYKVC
jgi:uncharacterized protein YjbI with pentapeptide repeats